MIQPGMEVAVLDRRLYTIGEAARLLELPPPTLRRWLEGFTVRRVEYPAVIRPAATGSSDVTWAEFVEAGYLREYRIKQVSLQKLRRFIDLARGAWDVPYPLAHFKPLVDLAPRDLLLLLKRLQDEAELEHELQPVHLVDPRTGQLLMGGPLQAFLAKVEFGADGVASRSLGVPDTLTESSPGFPRIRPSIQSPTSVPVSLSV